MIGKKIQWLSLGAACAVLLGGCGGGGGSGGSSLLGDSSGSGSGSSTSGTLSVSLSSSTVTAASPAVVTAVLVDSSGAPISGQVINFASTSSLGSFNPSSALTDGNGRAVVTLSPTTATTAGADTVVATSTVGSAQVTGTKGFQLTATNVAISAFTADVATLAAYAQTTLTVRLSGTVSTVPVTVAMASACVTAGKATLTPSTVSTSTGVATFTYRDQGCGSTATTDTLTASVSGSTVSSTQTVSLASPTASSIQFASASPSTIYLKGSGLVENSTVTFTVVDSSGNGLPGQSVVLDLTTKAGGLTIDDSSSAVTKTTDANGRVTVRINAGTIPTPVRVKATLASGGISTVSSNLAVAVGLPSQNNFSLSQGTMNIEGLEYDGVTDTYGIVASDRLGNPVPAGTTVNFVTTSGQVQAVTTTAMSGGLSVASAAFQTALPKPLDGRIVVLAYALGEESFLDANGNNTYDAGEDFQDLGDIYLDRRYDGVYQSGIDQLIGLQLGGASSCRAGINSELLGLGISAPSVPGTCDAVWGKAYVRRALIKVLSSSTAAPVFAYGAAPSSVVFDSAATCSAIVQQKIVPIGFNAAYNSGYDSSGVAHTVSAYPLGQGVVAGLGSTGTFSFYVTDANANAFNPMPAGTTISATGTSGLSVTVGGSPLGNVLTPPRASVTVAFDTTTTQGVVTIRITSPKGVVTSFSQAVSKGSATGVNCP